MTWQLPTDDELRLLLTDAADAWLAHVLCVPRHLITQARNRLGIPKYTYTNKETSVRERAAWLNRWVPRLAADGYIGPHRKERGA